MSSKKNPAELFKLKLVGNSMRPFLRHGAVVKCVKLKRCQHPSIGDIAVVEKTNGLLVHRVILSRDTAAGKQFLTKGDARLKTDGWIDRKSIIGVVAIGSRRKLFSMAIVGYSWGLLLLGKMLKRKRK